MKKLILGLFLTPLFASAMGDLFRPSYNPYPTGVAEDCSHTYESGGPARIAKTYDTTCLMIAKSVVADVTPDCNYDDYKQTDGYKSAQTQMLNEQQYLNWNRQTLEMMKYGYPQVQKFRDYFAYAYRHPTGQLEYELLLGKYCQRAVPTSTREAFAQNVDVPASIISFWNKDYIESRWSEELSDLTKKYPDTDFPTLIELNLQGESIWNKMVTCAGGNPELARSQYFAANFNCEGGSELKEEIKNYVQSVRVYFATSFIKPLKIDLKYEYEFVDAIVGNGRKIQANYDSFPTFHPMFIQAIQQLLVDIYPVGTNDRVKLDYIGKKLGITKDRPDSTLLQAVSQLDHFMPSGLAPQGLWPSANFAVFGQVQQVRSRLIAELIPDITVQLFHGVAFGAFTKLPDFYASNKTKLADEVRAMNKRYGL